MKREPNGALVGSRVVALMVERRIPNPQVGGSNPSYPANKRKEQVIFLEQNNKKIMSLAFGITAVMSGYLTNTILEILAAASGTIARLIQNEAVQHGVPVGVGILIFSVLQFNPKILGWADEVISEIRKIVWRSSKEVSALTFVVCIMLLICGLFFAGVDAVSTKLINFLITY